MCVYYTNVYGTVANKKEQDCWKPGHHNRVSWQPSFPLAFSTENIDCRNVLSVMPETAQTSFLTLHRQWRIDWSAAVVIFTLKKDGRLEKTSHPFTGISIGSRTYSLFPRTYIIQRDSNLYCFRPPSYTGRHSLDWVSDSRTRGKEIRFVEERRWPATSWRHRVNLPCCDTVFSFVLLFCSTLFFFFFSFLSNI